MDRVTTIVVPRTLDGQRIDFVISRVLKIPRRDAKHLVEQGIVALDAAKVTFGSRRVPAGARIEIHRAAAEASSPPASFGIIHEDAEIAVVDKPAGILTTGTGSGAEPTLEQLLGRSGGKIWPVHRLDRETSGVVVFARNAQSAGRLERAFRHRRVNKSYLGIVEGRMPARKGVFRGRLAPDRDYGETRYRVIRAVDRLSLVEFQPVTGRTNQIRRQLLSVNCSLVGEKKFLPRRPKGFVPFPRLALHSVEIGFDHPGSGRPVVYRSKLPDDMSRLVRMIMRR